MKRTIIFSTALFILTSCTDVIDVDVPVASPRLVIEASLDWEKGSPGNIQTIKLSTSTPYFDKEQSNSVTGAVVKVVNNTNNTEFLFTDNNDGTYTTTSFIPVLNQTYNLEILYQQELYQATETLFPVAEIDSVTQSTKDGFDKDAIELNTYFKDPEGIENYYFIRHFRRGDLLSYLGEFSDEFTDGNQMRDIFEIIENEDRNEKELNSGDIVDISLYGISRSYYNFLRILIEQSETTGDPFSSTPAPLKGNCINTTNPENYPYGFFRITEVARLSYTVK